jgi:hypothetical protein
MVAAAYADGSADLQPLYIQEWGDGSDQGHPIVFAQSTDPLVNVSCTIYCGSPGTGIRQTPAQIRIPAKARPGDGSDAHIGVVQPDGTEVDTWGTTMPLVDWIDGATLSAATVLSCGNFYTGTGSSGGRSGATVGDSCLAGGIVTESELANNSIPHALFVKTNCFALNYFVYPAYQHGDRTCSLPNGLPNGAHIWLDLTDAQINALPLAAFEKTLLRALHDYGGYVLDSVASKSHDYGLIHIKDTWESEAMYKPFGLVPPIDSWAQSQGWRAVNVNGVIRWTFSNAWNPLVSVGGWAAHLHILDSCAAQGTC